MQGTPKAIEIKGIVRNATVIGAQDGQAEDLINLRFMDGSWRASGDGRLIDFTMGREYTQLYIHTNVYRHLLGVYDGKLYWFADIADDGVTFTPLSTPVELASVTGDVWIVQNGHLLTIIDGADNFEYLVFKKGEDKYIHVKMNVNGKASDRRISPFDQVHFNLYSDPTDSELVHQKEESTLDLGKQETLTTDLYYLQGIHDPHDKHLKTDGLIDNDDQKNATKNYQNIMVNLISEASKKNQFTRPFLALVAYRLYDDSYIYSSNPVLLYPRELPTSQEGFVKSYSAQSDQSNTATVQSEIVDVASGNVCTLFENAIVFDYDFQNPRPIDNISCEYGKNKDAIGAPICGCFLTSEMNNGDSSYHSNTGTYVKHRGSGPIYYVHKNHVPMYCNGMACSYLHRDIDNFEIKHGTKYRAAVIGSKLCLSIDDIDILEENPEVFKSLCIFVTPQVDLFSTEVNNSDGSTHLHLRSLEGAPFTPDLITYYKRSTIMTISYAPKRFNWSDVAYKLMHSQFYLLRDYDRTTIAELKRSPIVDLSGAKYENIIYDPMSQTELLDIEATSRTVYLPKVSYMYNGRLHIANYKSYPFFGYPIDLFQLHNHSVKVQAGAWFPADADGQRVLPDLTGNADEYIQFTKGKVDIVYHSIFDDLIDKEAPYFLIKVYIDASSGEQVLCRYIQAYDPREREKGRADFIEDLNPLLTYPDVRATKMEIYYVYKVNLDLKIRMKEFTLTPYPYLNMAYFLNDNFKPIALSSFPVWKTINDFISNPDDPVVPPFDPNDPPIIM